MIGFALGILRLPPDAFWRLTMRELACAIEANTPSAAPLERATLQTLMTRYPDGR